MTWPRTIRQVRTDPGRQGREVLAHDAVFNGAEISSSLGEPSPAAPTRGAQTGQVPAMAEALLLRAQQLEEDRCLPAGQLVRSGSRQAGR